MDIAIGDYITLVNGYTILSGEVTGWHIAGGELISVRIEHIPEPIPLGEWKIEEEDEENE